MPVPKKRAVEKKKVVVTKPKKEVVATKTKKEVAVTPKKAAVSAKPKEIVGAKPRIQTAEGWRRSMLRKRKEKKS